MRTPVAAILAIVVVALSGCIPAATPSSSTEPSRAQPSASAPAIPSSTSGSATASPTLSPFPSPPVTTLASGVPLPKCAPAEPEATDAITFVASGHAWALSLNGHLTCLFAVADTGPFRWGPLGDRALLGGLEVKGVAGGPSVEPSDVSFATIEWSRPTGKSIVYAPIDGTSLEKAHIDGSPSSDVTPLPSSTYLSVAYHPSGEAFAFAVERSDGQSIWISTNVGKTPRRLVFSDEGNRFGAIGFDVDGKRLVYAAQHVDDNHADLHIIDVSDPTKAPVLWSGPSGPRILGIQPGPRTDTVAWTTGTSCEDSIAMAHTRDGNVRALPDVAEPTRALGWLDSTRILVATGRCDAPLDLSAVDVSTGSVVALVSGVSAAAVRTPVPTPPAPLPRAAIKGSGFS
jgi:hypothetical protein